MNIKNFFTVFLGVFMFFFSAHLVSAAESINNYQVNIDIKEDSSIRVMENIQYDFGTDRQHGIYRDIPLGFDTDYGNKNIEISKIEVLDNSRNERQFTTSRNGDDLRIKIGDPDKKVTGEQVYQVNYTVDWALRFFQDYDELYWNAIGTEWEIPIKQANISINLPESLSKDEVDFNCYKGEQGEDNDCNSMQTVETGNGVSSIEFSGSNLGNGVGMTTVVTFPKSIVQQPGVWAQIKKAVKDNWIFGLPVFVLIFMTWLWYKKGRDPEGKGSVVAQYEPLEGMTPVQLGMLVDDDIDKKDISSELIHLANQGFIKIKYGDDEEYILQKQKSAEEASNEFDQKILNFVFNGQDEIKLSDIKKNASKNIRKNNFKRGISESLVNAGYYAKNPRQVKGIYFVIGFFVIFGSFFFFDSGLYSGLSLVISGIIIMLFANIMPAKTKKGAKAKEHVLGFKQYLSVAEKERMKFHNAPEKKPETFENFLPYAMALGVEEQWADIFEDIYDQAPGWYEGRQSRYGAHAIVGQMNSFHSEVGSSMTSSSSGSSGISGGSVGGGAGGGGGGSW